MGLDPATPDAYQNMDLASVLHHLEHLGRPDWKRAILFQLASHSLLRRCPASVRKDLVPAARRNFASIVWINEAKALPHSIRQIRQEGPPASVPTLFLLSNGKGTWIFPVFLHVKRLPVLWRRRIPGFSGCNPSGYFEYTR